MKSDEIGLVANFSRFMKNLFLKNFENYFGGFSNPPTEVASVGGLELLHILKRYIVCIKMN